MAGQAGEEGFLFDEPNSCAYWGSVSMFLKRV